MTTAAEVAGLLGGMRKVHKSVSADHDSGLSLVAAEALLWVAGGVDHMTDLQRHMGLSAAGACRVLSLLRGRARLNKGKVIRSAFDLVKVRSHPHRRGYELSLTDHGQELLGAIFPSGHPADTTEEDK